MKAVLLAIAFSLIVSLPILLTRLYDQRDTGQNIACQRNQWNWANMPNEEPIMPSQLISKHAEAPHVSN